MGAGVRVCFDPPVCELFVFSLLVFAPFFAFSPIMGLSDRFDAIASKSRAPARRPQQQQQQQQRSRPVVQVRDRRDRRNSGGGGARSQGGNNSKPKFTGACNNCGKIGHKAAECRSAPRNNNNGKGVTGQKRKSQPNKGNTKKAKSPANQPKSKQKRAAPKDEDALANDLANYFGGSEKTAAQAKKIKEELEAKKKAAAAAAAAQKQAELDAQLIEYNNAKAAEAEAAAAAATEAGESTEDASAPVEAAEGEEVRCTTVFVHVRSAERHLGTAFSLLRHQSFSGGIVRLPLDLLCLSLTIIHFWSLLLVLCCDSN